mmetsp:Transcript_37112/g.48785  ORF Transcript_37112/g.48785 Transcript_37112/m.48785 type:complete len:81 (-) Transcript_37112:269-511(-)
MLQVLYNNIYNFIEGGERRTNNTYQEFPTPRVITEAELKLKYVYNYVFDNWHKQYKEQSVEWFRSIPLGNDQNVWDVYKD